MYRLTHDENTISGMVEQYGDMLFRLCYLNQHERAAAETTAADVFLFAFMRAKFADENQVGNWLVRVAIDYSRDNANPADEDRGAGLRRDWPGMSDDEMRALQALFVLKPGDRVIACLDICEGFNLADIGSVLGVKTTTVISRARQICEQLKNRLLEFDPEQVAPLVKCALMSVKPSDTFKSDTIHFLQQSDGAGADAGRIKHLRRYTSSGKPSRWLLKCIAVAAAAVLFTVGIAIPLATSRTMPQKDLPTIPLEIFSSGYAGDGVVYLGDFSSCVVNRQRYLEIGQAGEMPVYHNPMLTLYQGDVAAELEHRVTHVASILGVELADIEVYHSSTDPAWAQEDSPSFLFMKSGVVEIMALRSGGVSIYLGPDPAVGTPPAQEADIAEHEAYAGSLLDKYKALFYYMDSPTALARAYYPGPDGVPAWEYSVFDASGDAAQEIASQCMAFGAINVVPRNLNTSAWFMERDLSQVAGVYPIWTEDEARKLLTSKLAFTVCGEEYPGERNIVAVELIYVYSDEMMYLEPYYKFYLELSGEAAGNTKRCGVWFVPAVRSEYFESTPN